MLGIQRTSHEFVTGHCNAWKSVVILPLDVGFLLDKIILFLEIGAEKKIIAGQYHDCRANFSHTSILIILSRFPVNECLLEYVAVKPLPLCFGENKDLQLNLIHTVW